MLWYTNTDNSYPDDDPEVIFGTLFGTEHPWFWKIHITALISLGKIENTCLILSGIHYSSEYVTDCGTFKYA